MMKPVNIVEREAGGEPPASSASSEIDLHQNREDQADPARSNVYSLERTTSNKSGHELCRTVGDNSLNRNVESLGSGGNEMGPRGSRMSSDDNASLQSTSEGSMGHRNTW